MAKSSGEAAGLRDLPRLGDDAKIGSAQTDPTTVQGFLVHSEMP